MLLGGIHALKGTGIPDGDVTRNRDVWLVLGSGTLLGVVVLAYYVFARPATFGLNYRVYHVAAETALSGGNFYAVSPADSSFQYLYPPVTVLAFVPLAVLGDWPVGYLLLTAVSLAASTLAALYVCRYVAALGHAVPWHERALVAAFLAVSTHTAISLVYGQVNHLLVAAIVLGLVALANDDGHRAGVLLALPAYLKLVPGVVGLYLLRRRAWRAVGAAVATALGVTLAGFAVFGLAGHRTYLFDALLPRRDAAAFVGGLDPAAEYVTLRRPLSVVFPTVDPIWYTVGAAACLLPVLGALYWRVDTHTDRMVALFGTLAVGILFVPSLLLYYSFLAFPLIVLLYDLPAGPARRLFVAGGVLANISFTYGGLRDLLAALPLEGATAETIAAVLRPVLTVGTPVLYGCLLMLAGCLVYWWNSRGQTTRPETSPR